MKCWSNSIKIINTDHGCKLLRFWENRFFCILATDKQTDRQTDEQLHAYVTPLLKKSGLDKNEAGNYRPVSELSCCLRCWKNSQSADRLLLDRCEAVRDPSVGLQEIPLYWDCSVANYIRPYKPPGQRRCGTDGVFRLIRQGDAAEPFVNFIWHPRRRAQVDQIVFDESHWLRFV